MNKGDFLRRGDQTKRLAGVRALCFSFVRGCSNCQTKSLEKIFLGTRSKYFYALYVSHLLLRTSLALRRCVFATWKNIIFVNIICCARLSATKRSTWIHFDSGFFFSRYWRPRAEENQFWFIVAPREIPRTMESEATVVANFHNSRWPFCHRLFFAPLNYHKEWAYRKMSFWKISRKLLF